MVSDVRALVGLSTHSNSTFLDATKEPAAKRRRRKRSKRRAARLFEGSTRSSLPEESSAATPSQACRNRDGVEVAGLKRVPGIVHLEPTQEVREWTASPTPGIASSISMSRIRLAIQVGTDLRSQQPPARRRPVDLREVEVDPGHGHPVSPVHAREAEMTVEIPSNTSTTFPQLLNESVFIDSSDFLRDLGLDRQPTALRKLDSNVPPKKGDAILESEPDVFISIASEEYPLSPPVAFSTLPLAIPKPRRIPLDQTAFNCAVRHNIETHVVYRNSTFQNREELGDLEDDDETARMSRAGESSEFGREVDSPAMQIQSRVRRRRLSLQPGSDQDSEISQASSYYASTASLSNVLTDPDAVWSPTPRHHRKPPRRRRYSSASAKEVFGENEW